MSFKPCRLSHENLPQISFQSTFAAINKCPTNTFFLHQFQVTLPKFEHTFAKRKQENSSKGMEGLLPMLVHALKKQKPHHSFRCLSEGSNRSYHMLIGPQDSVNGSSHHRRTRSEFKPSTADHFLDQRFAPEFSHSNSFNNTNGTRQIGSGTYQVRK